jgi:hypothetical protein
VDEAERQREDDSVGDARALPLPEPDAESAAEGAAAAEAVAEVRGEGDSPDALGAAEKDAEGDAEGGVGVGVPPPGSEPLDDTVTERETRHGVPLPVALARADAAPLGEPLPLPLGEGDTTEAVPQGEGVPEAPLGEGEGAALPLVAPLRDARGEPDAEELRVTPVEREREPQGEGLRLPRGDTDTEGEPDSEGEPESVAVPRAGEGDARGDALLVADAQPLSVPAADTVSDVVRLGKPLRLPLTECALERLTLGENVWLGVMLSVFVALLLRLRDGEAEAEPLTVPGAVGTALSCGVKDPLSESQLLREALPLGEAHIVGEGVGRGVRVAEGDAVIVGARPEGDTVAVAEGQRLSVARGDGEGGAGVPLAHPLADRREEAVPAPLGVPPPAALPEGLPLLLLEGDTEGETEGLPESEAPPTGDGDTDTEPLPAGVPLAERVKVPLGVGEAVLAAPTGGEGLLRADGEAPATGEALPLPPVGEAVVVPDTNREGVAPPDAVRATLSEATAEALLSSDAVAAAPLPDGDTEAQGDEAPERLAEALTDGLTVHEAVASGERESEAAGEPEGVVEALRVGSKGEALPLGEPPNEPVGATSVPLPHAELEGVTV